MFKKPASFIGKFKIGDNIHYNLRILSVLYKHKEDSNTDKHLYNKFIIIILCSIIEAILYDFCNIRIKTFTWEGVSNIAENVKAYFFDKHINQFGTLISSAERHNLLNSRDGKFYEELEYLKKIRDRIHIQNKHDYKPLDEKEVFKNEENVLLAERCLEKLINIMNSDHSRGEKATTYVSDFTFPWAMHFSEKNIEKTSECPYCGFENLDDGSGWTMCYCGKIY